LPLAALLALVALGLSLADPDGYGATAPASAEVPSQEAAPAGVPTPSVQPSPDRSAALRPGETLGAVLQGLGLSADEAYRAALASARYVDLRQLRAGTPWSAYLDDQGRLERLELRLAGRGELGLDREGEGWEPAWRDFQKVTRIRIVQGRLADSLEAAIEQAGAQPELAYQLADVLQWDLDFSRDLRVGDTFRVLYEELEVEGSSPRPDRVLAVSYQHPGGRPIEAFYFRQGARSGYYDDDGRPLQKMFLRNPLPYSRITSRFSNRRFHPILGRYMPHHGVDYGAPTGTPVRVTASGTVAVAGWKGGGGRVVEVRHPNGYLTGYLHLSRIAAGVRAGAHVEQGEVIGYVGQSGLATAPHLDYRVQLNGRWIDPLSLKVLPAAPIPQSELADFVAVRDAMRASLESGDPYAPPTLVARSDSRDLAGAPRPASTGR